MRNLAYFAVGLIGLAIKIVFFGVLIFVLFAFDSGFFAVIIRLASIGIGLTIIVISIAHKPEPKMDPKTFKYYTPNPTSLDRGIGNTMFLIGTFMVLLPFISMAL